MNIQQAIETHLRDPRLQISRPSMMNERNSYLKYCGPNQPFMLCRFNSSLGTAWCPTPDDLLITDWFLFHF